MNKFTIRVELTNASYDEYMLLHDEMEKRGFRRYIVSDDGTKYDLPDAEYDFRGSQEGADVLALAKSAAGETGCKFRILVTQAHSRTWSGLDKIG
ncbi:MAG: DUF2622 domain-containing protein [Candidatus Moranbacteria bacterium]|nr:DUF2622 domain-containing protein [Candidatus Moranbacteria bacterium]